jgi:hypothetical protein
MREPAAETKTNPPTGTETEGLDESADSETESDQELTGGQNKLHNRKENLVR